MSESSGEKTEEPTPKKLQDARRKGQIWKSRDMTGAVVFIIGFAVMIILAPWMLERFKLLLDLAFRFVSVSTITDEDIFGMVYEGLINLVLITTPIVMAGALFGLLADFLQVGSLFTLDPLMPKLDKINPIKGLKNLFSKKQIVELLKATFKMLSAIYVAYTLLRDEMRMVVSTANGGPELVMLAGGNLVYQLTMRLGMLLVLFSIFDLWWQHKVFMKDMMMTKDEVKREYKESEGDPHHKARRKEAHQEILEGAMMDEVATADVIVTNPTHYAVALRYQRQTDGAPRVIAKGLDSKALQIRQIARQAGVAEMRNVPLAHALYRVDLGQEIPEQLYDAVAEVLNFVYAEQQRREGAG